jgi:hypothetical protein
VNTKDARRIAFGTTPASDLPEYFAAWQHLYDAEVELKQPDIDYLDKLICDGNVTPREGYFDILDK